MLFDYKVTVTTQPIGSFQDKVETHIIDAVNFSYALRKAQTFTIDENGHNLNVTNISVELIPEEQIDPVNELYNMMWKIHGFFSYKELTDAGIDPDKLTNLLINFPNE